MKLLSVYFLICVVFMHSFAAEYSWADRPYKTNSRVESFNLLHAVDVSTRSCRKGYSSCEWKESEFLDKRICTGPRCCNSMDAKYGCGELKETSDGGWTYIVTCTCIWNGTNCTRKE